MKKITLIIFFFLILRISAQEKISGSIEKIEEKLLAQKPNREINTYSMHFEGIVKTNEYHKLGIMVEDISKDELKKQSTFFGGDSLKGFVFESELNELINNEGIKLLNEFKAGMFRKQQTFINYKYGTYKKSELRHISTTTNELSKTVEANSISSSLCNNLDFENGDLSTWTVSSGYNANSNAVLTIPASSFTAGVIATNQNIYSCSDANIITAAYGNDPVGNFPGLDPNGASTSIRLGGFNINVSSGYGFGCASSHWNNISYSNGEKIEKTVLVSAANALLTYDYAVILNDGGHSNGQQPYFHVFVTDVLGNVLSTCTQYYVQAAAGVPPVGFLNSGYVNTYDNSVFYYKNWTSNSMNLSAYIGQTVKISFVAAGCTFGSHPGYAYIDAVCGPVSINSSGNNLCPGTTAILTAPNIDAGAYNWAGSGITGLTTNTVSINSTGIYTCIVTPSQGAACSYSLSYSMNYYSSPTITVNSGSICVGDSFTMTPSGANTYTINGGTAVVSPTINSSYNVTGTDLNGCASSNTAISSVMVNPLPIISVNNGSICSSESYTINPSGAVTYTISGGSVVVSPTISTTYTVLGTDINSCTNSQTLSVGVNTSCVWPGDANSDGIADNLDILELGLHYTSTGGTRIVTSNLWQAFDAPNWVGTITSGKNLHHSDCNGDGTINQNDTLAVFINYSLTHPFKQTNLVIVNPQISIVPDQASVYNGQWGTASIFLGDASNPINSINGVAYTLTYDNSLIEPDSVWLEYPTSFLNTTNTNLHFRKRDFTNGTLYTATTHTNNLNVSGNGKIATLHYKILSSLTTTNVLNIGITQANQSDALGLITPLTSGSASLLAVANTVGIKQNGKLNNMIFIFPNPTNGILNIQLQNVQSSINNLQLSITNTLGQILLTTNILNQTTQINIQNLSNGIYFVKVLEGEKVIGVQKIIKE